jgi:hypothetical protein
MTLLLGEEHDAQINPGAVDSYCTLKLFHAPAVQAELQGIGYISQDGHSYTCKNPALTQKSYHMYVQH